MPRLRRADGPEFLSVNEEQAVTNPCSERHEGLFRSSRAQSTPVLTFVVFAPFVVDPFFAAFVWSRSA
jgi:hypothetical protein